MSNTFPSTLDLPDQNSSISGSQIFETDVKKMVESLNWGHAYQGTGTLYSGTFHNKTFQTVDTNPSGATLRVRIPTISSHHTTLEILTVHAGAGTLDISLNDGSSTSTSNISMSDTGSLNVLSLSENDLTGVSLGSSGYLTVEIGLTATVSTLTALRINSLCLRWKPLTSPLPTNQATLGSNTFTPFAPSRYGANCALPSFLGHAIIDNIKTLRERPRVYYNFTGLGLIYNENSGSLQASISFVGLTLNSPKTTKAFEYIFQGSEDFDDKLQVHIYVKNYTSDFDVRICGHTVTITGNGWQNYELDLPLIQSEYSNAFELPVYEIGPSSSLNLPREATVSTAVITSLSIWGP